MLVSRSRPRPPRPPRVAALVGLLPLLAALTSCDVPGACATRYTGKFRVRGELHYDRYVCQDTDLGSCEAIYCNAYKVECLFFGSKTCGAVVSRSGKLKEGVTPDQASQRYPNTTECGQACERGEYNECTCGVDDPCGWRNDGFCDTYSGCSEVGRSMDEVLDDAADCASLDQQ